MNIPRKNNATCLVKCNRVIYGAVHFDKVVVLIKCKNAFPTAGRNCIFARPILAIRRLLRVGSESS